MSLEWKHAWLSLSLALACSDGTSAVTNPACDGGCVGPVYSALGNKSKWSTFDISSVNPDALSFGGAAFDGRYLYLVPANYAPFVARYDTQEDFKSGDSWSTFGITTVSPGGLAGAAFDGRYVYFVPAGDGHVARYDTLATFSTRSSWATFDTTLANAMALGFVGAAFDGRYIYFVPHANGGYMTDGIVARYDTQAPFDAVASWSTFDIAGVDAGATGFAGAVFDGRYLYFVPSFNGKLDGLAARYDTQAAFATPASWSTFDITSVDSGAKGFVGGAFDGRYLYFVPAANASGTVPGTLNPASIPDGVGARYDTMGAFATGSSWSTFDIATANPDATGFRGAAFDGRYVYFVPYSNNAYGLADGLLARYDTEAAFKTGSSWSTFDMTTVVGGAQGFIGAAFDGRYVYFVPYNSDNGIVLRFDAKTPPSLPAGYANGSFY